MNRLKYHYKFLKAFLEDSAIILFMLFETIYFIVLEADFIIRDDMTFREFIFWIIVLIMWLTYQLFDKVFLTIYLCIFNNYNEDVKFVLMSISLYFVLKLFQKVMNFLRAHFYFYMSFLLSMISLYITIKGLIIFQTYHLPWYKYLIESYIITTIIPKIKTFNMVKDYIAGYILMKIFKIFVDIMYFILVINIVVDPEVKATVCTIIICMWITAIILSWFSSKDK